MKVILTTNIKKLGKIGDLVEVKNGYARNFLFPNNMALRDSEKNLEYYNNIKEEIKNKEEKKLEEAKKIIEKINPKAKFDVVSNPEFLREGNAIEDFMRPDRVVVGYETEKAKEVISKIYKPLYLIETPILFTDLKTAELIKYTGNAFLAVKISYINQMADLCEKVGADVHDISRGIGLDKRIGSKFLHPGPGYGGSCFPKDTQAILKTAQDFEIDLSLIREAIHYNNNIRKGDT